MKTFYIKPRIHFGKNALGSLSEIRATNAVIFTDAFMEHSGRVDEVVSLMKQCENIHVFADITPDPPIELVVKALAFMLDHNADVAVALGGGSSIDAAKSTILMYEKKTGVHVPLVAIPTTSGTGSEVTKFSVISDTQANEKYPLISEKLLPDVAILSSRLTMTIPPAVTADTGFDVMTHALEAYISTEANDFTDAFAEKALQLSFEYLPIAYRDGKNKEAREKMQNASCLAGMAFNDAGLGVNHGIAHILGALFHIPHGRANAIMLPHVMQFNAGLEGGNKGELSPACLKLAKIARLLNLPAYSPRQGAMSLINEIRRTEREMGIPQTLGEAGVKAEAYQAQKAHIIHSAMHDACTATNPREVDEAAVEKILKNIERF